MLKDAQGNEITGTLTPEEAEAHVNLATDKLKTEYEAKMSELNKKIGENTNEGLRKKTEKTEEDKKNLEKEMGELKSTISKQIREAALSPLAGNDTKFREKLESQYNRLKPQDEHDAVAVASAMKDAYKLVSDVPLSALNVHSSGGFGGAHVPSSENELEEMFSSDVRDLGKKMGLTDEDYKKFGSKVPKQYK